MISRLVLRDVFRNRFAISVDLSAIIQSDSLLHCCKMFACIQRSVFSLLFAFSRIRASFCWLNCQLQYDSEQRMGATVLSADAGAYIKRRGSFLPKLTTLEERDHYSDDEL